MDSIWGIWEMMNVAVLVPQWYLWAIGLCGVVVSLLAFFLVSWVSYKRCVSSIQVVDDSVEKVEELVSSKGATRVAGSESRHMPSASPKSASSVSFAVSDAQLQELRNRVGIGGGFLVADVSSLLKESQGRIVKRIRAGELVSYRDQAGRLWVSARSVADLLGLSTQSDAVGVTSGVVTKKEEPVAEPVVVERVVSTPSYKPIPPIRQHYWYYVDGESSGVKTLADALSVIGYTGTAEWNKLPKPVQERIRRERVV